MTRTVAVVARKGHHCTYCGAPIGRGDEYVCRTTAPWALGDWSDGHWLTEKVCSDCTGSRN